MYLRNFVVPYLLKHPWHFLYASISQPTQMSSKVYLVWLLVLSIIYLQLYCPFFFFFFPLKSIKLFQTFFIATLLCCPANCRIISYIKFIFKFQYTYIISVIKYIHMYFLKSLKSFFLKLFIIILVFDVQIIA